MHRARLILSTCAIACLALPTLALAQHGPGAATDQSNDRTHQADTVRHTGQHGHTAIGGPAPGAPPAGPLLRHPSGEPRSPSGAAGVERHRRERLVAPPLIPKPPVSITPTYPPRGQIGALRERHLPPLGGWNRGLRGADRDNAGQQWRDQHRGWDRDASWKRDPNWWRHDRGFRFYLGPRLGFFFMPTYGYISVPTEYQTHYWRAGDRLPSWFWRFVVRDYAAYGLPPPPDGCAWVWVDDDVALIDLDDGYILDIVHNLW